MTTSILIESEVLRVFNGRWNMNKNNGYAGIGVRDGRIYATNGACLMCCDNIIPHKFMGIFDLSSFKIPAKPKCEVVWDDENIWMMLNGIRVEINKDKRTVPVGSAIESIVKLDSKHENRIMIGIGSDNKAWDFMSDCGPLGFVKITQSQDGNHLAGRYQEKWNIYILGLI